MKQSSSRAQAIALHNIDIASPCTASWDKMKGDNRVRHCGDCNKNVFNLSAMPEADAAALVAGNTNGSLCVRFYRREDGTVMTSDCGASPRAQLRQAWRKLPGMASMAVVALSAAGCTADTVQVANVENPSAVMVTMGAPPPPMLMGDIAPPPSIAKPQDGKLRENTDSYPRERN